MARIAKIGLDGLHAGKYVGDGVAYTEVVAIGGMLNATIEVSEFNENFYSDDSISNVVQGLETITISIEVEGLSMEERALLLGETVVKGAIASNANDIASRPYMGIAFRSKQSNGKYMYMSIPKCKFNPPSDEFATQEGGVERTTITMEATAMPLGTGVYKVICDENATGVDASYISSFLTTIPQDVPEVSVSQKSK